MSESALAVGAAVVIAALCAVLAVYLYKVGSVVRHLTETLSDKVGPGAAEVAEHVGNLGPAAAAMPHHLDALRHLPQNLIGHYAAEE